MTQTNRAVLTPLIIAEICLNAVSVHAQAFGGTVPKWNEALQEQQQQAVDEVLCYLNRPEATPYQLHGGWIQDMLDAGWSRGNEFSAERKLHPGLVPFVDLPAERQAEKLLVHELVRQLTPFLEPITAAPPLPENMAEPNKALPDGLDVVLPAIGGAAAVVGS